MDRKSTDNRLNPLLPLLLLGGLALILPLTLVAQVPVDENGEPIEALDPFDYIEPSEQAIQPMASAALAEASDHKPTTVAFALEEGLGAAVEVRM